MCVYLIFLFISVKCNFPLQEALTAAATEFTNNLKPTKASKYRGEFKEPKESPSRWWRLIIPFGGPLAIQWVSSYAQFFNTCWPSKGWLSPAFRGYAEPRKYGGVGEAVWGIGSGASHWESHCGPCGSREDGMLQGAEGEAHRAWFTWWTSPLSYSSLFYVDQYSYSC